MASVTNIGVPGQPLNNPSLVAWQAAVRDAFGGDDNRIKDTGWRNITASLINGFSASGGGVFVRRMGRSVTLSLVSVSRATDVPGGAGAVVLGAPPSGFAPTANVHNTMNITNPLNPTLPAIITGGWIQCAVTPTVWVNAGNITAGADLFALFTYPTDNAWPTTLPGVPG